MLWRKTRVATRYPWSRKIAPIIASKQLACREGSSRAPVLAAPLPSSRASPSPEPLGQLGERDGVDQGRPELGQLALVVPGEAPEEVLADDQLEDRVAQVLEPLVVVAGAARLAALVVPGGVGHRLAEQGRPPEVDLQAGRQVVETLLLLGGQGHPRGELRQRTGGLSELGRGERQLRGAGWWLGGLGRGGRRGVRGRRANRRLGRHHPELAGGGHLDRRRHVGRRSRRPRGGVRRRGTRRLRGTRRPARAGAVSPRGPGLDRGGRLGRRARPAGIHNGAGGGGADLRRPRVGPAGAIRGDLGNGSL